MRILLVEDEPDLGAAIKQSLDRSNHVVDWAVDGLDAWDYFNLKEYHLGIFDERPRADGRRKGTRSSRLAITWNIGNRINQAN